VETPVHRQFNEVDFFAENIRPVGAQLVTDAAVIRRKVVRHHAGVVKEAEFDQQTHRVWAEIGGGRTVADWRLARDATDTLAAAFQDATLFVRFDRRRILVAVPVVADLASGIGDTFYQVGKRIDRVAGNEPGRGHLIPTE